MRITKEKENINYTSTRAFFDNRAGKYNKENPYSVTMYQDNNVKLVKERNEREIEKLKPMLELDKQSKVLDVACGIGRWADAIQEDIQEYFGVDFSASLIEIARKRSNRNNFDFQTGTVNNIEEVLQLHNKEKYNVVLLIGILMYVNDEDLTNVFFQLERRCDENAIICIREPMGLVDRLTLKEFFSEELKDNYNAIYRTRDELVQSFDESLLKKGFVIVKEGFLFDEDELNNRKETSQYYFILKR